MGAQRRKRRSRPRCRGTLELASKEGATGPHLRQEQQVSWCPWKSFPQPLPMLTLLEHLLYARHIKHAFMFDEPLLPTVQPRSNCCLISQPRELQEGA